MLAKDCFDSRLLAWWQEESGQPESERSSVADTRERAPKISRRMTLTHCLSRTTLSRRGQRRDTSSHGVVGHRCMFCVEPFSHRRCQPGEGFSAIHSFPNLGLFLANKHETDIEQAVSHTFHPLHRTRTRCMWMETTAVRHAHSKDTVRTRYNHVSPLSFAHPSLSLL